MRWASIACAVSFATFLYVRWRLDPSMQDLATYRDEGRALLRGADLYGAIGAPDGLRATYPPFAALLFSTFSLLSLGAARIVDLALMLGSLLVVVELSRRLVSRHVAPVGAAAVPLLTAVSLWFEPVWTTLRYGQINLLLLALVLWDFTRSPGARGRGIGVGIATGLKVTPGLLVIYLLLTRRFRFAATATGTWAGTVLLTRILRPDLTEDYWTEIVFATKRVGQAANPANQSVVGVLCRLTHHADATRLGVLASAAIAVLGLTCSVLAYRRRGEAWGVCAAAVTGLLASPISWTHHWVWCVPIALLLWAASRGTPRLRAAYAVMFAVFASYLVWIVPDVHALNVRLVAWKQLVSLPYVAFGLLFLPIAALPRPRSRRIPSATAGVPKAVSGGSRWARTR